MIRGSVQGSPTRLKCLTQKEDQRQKEERRLEAPVTAGASWQKKFDPKGFRFGKHVTFFV